eukprot:sb/3465333/
MKLKELLCSHFTKHPKLFHQIWNRGDGVKLCRLLVEFRVLQHEDDKFHFADEFNKFYRFCWDCPNSYPISASEKRTWCQGLEVMRQFNLEQSGTKKRRHSFLVLFGKDKDLPMTFKGKTLIEWLERRTDFENREDCKRFVTCLLKLDFIRSAAQKGARFSETTEYWFYVSSLIESSSPRRSEMKTVAEPSSSPFPAICVSRGDQPGKPRRRISEIGLTTEFMQAVTLLQKVHNRRDERIKLKNSCEVLSSKSQSRESVLSWPPDLPLDWGREFERQHRTSECESHCETTSSIVSHFTDCDDDVPGSFNYIKRLQSQYPASAGTTTSKRRIRNLSSCSSELKVRVDRIRIGQSTTQTQKEKAALLMQIEIHKFGVSRPALGHSKQGDSTESKATKSSGECHG